MKPLIGITTYGRGEKAIETLFYDEFFYLPTLYVDAVRRAGGVPVLLPPGEPDLTGWLEITAGVVDGIIVSGGGDIDPVTYRGNRAHEQLHGIDQERDKSELGLLRNLVIKAELPLLCICRGMQALNVALGGTLTEHIPDVREKDMHRGANGGWTLQEVTVDPGSFLAEALGTTHLRAYSGHHQAVKDVAPGLQVAANAPDGIVEALELPGHPWLVAVQWHPEMSAATDPVQQRLFNRFVQKAGMG